MPAAHLAPRLPPGCLLDTWDGRAYASLVALRMERVRIVGLRLPGLSAFAQVNLRFYVRHADRPAVCFVQELVPHRLLVAGARLMYGEPFRGGYIQAQVTDGPGGAAAQYLFGLSGPEARLGMQGGPERPPPPDGTFAHWVKERIRGCRARTGGLRTFDVVHPPWMLRPVETVDIDVPFSRIYGPEWGLLDGATPASLLYAVGSEVTVSMPA